MREEKPLDSEEVQLYLKCNNVPMNELIETLSGFEELFTLANQRAGNPPLSIKVVSLKNGSVEISCVLELWNKTKAMVLGSDAQAILSIVGLLTICKNVFADIRSIQKGVVSGCEYALKPLKKMLSAAFKKDGFIELKGSEEKITISEKEADFICSLENNHSLEGDYILINEYESTQYYSIASVTFKREKKGFNRWKLAEGNHIFSAVIEDKEFLYLVNERNLAIHRDDLLFCKVRTKQYRHKLSSAIKTEKIVEQVLKYDQFPDQQDLLKGIDEKP